MLNVSKMYMYVYIIYTSRSFGIAATLFAKHWRKFRPCNELTIRKFYLSPQSTAFEEYYDTVQEYLEILSGMDELLAGEYIPHIQFVLTH